MSLIVVKSPKTSSSQSFIIIKDSPLVCFLPNNSTVLREINADLKKCYCQTCSSSSLNFPPLFCLLRFQTDDDTSVVKEIQLAITENLQIRYSDPAFEDFHKVSSQNHIMIDKAENLSLPLGNVLMEGFLFL